MVRRTRMVSQGPGMHETSKVLAKDSPPSFCIVRQWVFFRIKRTEVQNGSVNPWHYAINSYTVIPNIFYRESILSFATHKPLGKCDG